MSDVKSITMIKTSLQLELSYVYNFLPESVRLVEEYRCIQNDGNP